MDQVVVEAINNFLFNVQQSVIGAIAGIAVESEFEVTKKIWKQVEKWNR